MAPPFSSEISEFLVDTVRRIQRPLNSFMLKAACGSACGKGKVEVKGNLHLESKNLYLDAPPILGFTYGEGPYKANMSIMCDAVHAVGLGIDADLAKYLPGLKLGASAGIGLEDGSIGASLESSLKRENVAIEIKADKDDIKQSVNCSIVGGWGNFFAGLYGIAEQKTDEDISSADIYSVHLGHWSPNTRIFGNWYNFGSYDVSLWHKPSDKTHVFVSAGFHSWTSSRSRSGSAEEGENEKPVIETAADSSSASSGSGSYKTSINFGGSLLLTPTTKLTGFIDSSSQVNLGIETELRPETILTLAAQIDGKNLSGGYHQIGFTFEINSDFSSKL